MVEDARAGQQMHAPEVHHAQVAGIIQVQVEIDVVGPHAHPQVVFIEDANRRERTDMLANSQSRNADKADEVRQALLPVESVKAITQSR